MEKIIKELPNYKISETGIVTNIKRNKEVQPFKADNGYLRISLSKDGKQTKYPVHRLVYMTFKDDFILENSSGEKMVINHIDGDKQNNHIDNLELVTHYDNCSECFRKDRETMSSKLPGVSFDKQSNKYRARITRNNITKHLGFFTTEEEAYNAYKTEKYDN